jgi:hypothetical protein
MQYTARQLQQLDHNNGNGCFLCGPYQGSYLEDNWDDPVSSQKSACEEKTRRLV